jgi:prepilin signal peptidase PulO-like enzyme (type II secretory pathway)
MFGTMLFILGAAFGSFLNVLSLRYDPNRFLFARASTGGRSHCPHCRRTLRAYELIPLLSFLFLRGRCRTCGKKLTLQYPVVEALCGVIFLLVGRKIYLESIFLFPGMSETVLLLIIGLYLLVFAGLLLMSLIDRVWQIIPDELTVILAGLGISLIALSAASFEEYGASFVGSYAPLFGFREWGILVNRIIGSVIAGGFLLTLYIGTRGRGIGFGDVKLSFALGLIFGWPDVLLLHLFAFILGSVYGIAAILKGKGMKSLLPFGPFLALGALVVFLWGREVLDLYFSLFGFNPLELI